MIIDKILDRYDAEKYGDFSYCAHDFYIDVLAYGGIGNDITAAMDYGTEKDVTRALCEYIEKGGYNPGICDYIRARVWLENTSKALPCVSIGRD